MDMLLSWCDNEHLEWDDKQKTAYGYYEGYPFCIKSEKGSYLLCLFCEGEASFTQSKIANTNYENGLLTTSFSHENGASLMYLTSSINRLCKAARDAGLKPCLCRVCGKNEHLRVWEGKEGYTVLCINCRERQSDEEKAVVHTEPLPSAQNFAGAVIGAFLGLIFYAVVYQLGSFAPLCGAAVALFICVCFSRRGGTFTKHALGLCSVIGIFTIIMAQILSLWLTLYVSYFLHGMTMWQTVLLLPSFLITKGVLRAALTDVLTAAVPMALITLWWYLRQKKKKK